MKIKQYLKSLPVGKIVTDKRVLALFKRMGYIFDYNYGYLCARHFFNVWGDGETTLKMHHIFCNRNAHLQKEDDWETWVNEGLLNDKNGFLSDTFEYEGMRFGKQYVSGCFSPYLVKVAD